MAIAKELPKCTVSGTAAGLHMLVTFPSGLRGAAVAEAAEARGIRLKDLQECRLIPGDREGIVLGYGNLDDETIEVVVRELAQVIRTVRVSQGN